jgi:predicted TIM-barrel fold metal-dependent hydrolase
MSHLVDILGSDRVTFGSDYPHPEGLAEPADFVGELGNLLVSSRPARWAT